MICKWPLPILYLRSVNTVTHSYDTSAVLTQILLAKDRHKPHRRFQVSTIFLRSFDYKFHVQSSGWTESFKQVQKHYLLLNSNKIIVNFVLLFHFNNIIFVPIISLSSGTDIKHNCTNRNFSYLVRNVSQYQTSRRLHCVISLLHASAQINWISGFLYAHCTYITLRSSICNKLCKEGRCSDVIRSVNRQCCCEIQNDRTAT